LEGKGMQRTTSTTARRDQVAAVIELLAETWPACFSIYEKRRKPLKVGIHLDILAALDGAVTPAKLSRALRRYGSNKCYRARLVAGAARVGLDGEPAGSVTPEQSTRQQAAPSASTIPSAPPRSSPPSRTTLADLRAAARARREASP
jgi:ProP effector